jgi:hypothetical protein
MICDRGEDTEDSMLCTALNSSSFVVCSAATQQILNQEITRKLEAHQLAASSSFQVLDAGTLHDVIVR